MSEFGRELKAARDRRRSLEREIIPRAQAFGDKAVFGAQLGNGTSYTTIQKAFSRFNYHKEKGYTDQDCCSEWVLISIAEAVDRLSALSTSKHEVWSDSVESAIETVQKSVEASGRLITRWVGIVQDGKRFNVTVEVIEPKKDFDSSNWECPQDGTHHFINSLTWHLWTVHGLTMNPAQYSTEFHMWKRMGKHSAFVNDFFQKEDPMGYEPS